MSETSFPTKPSEVEYILAHGIGKMLIERYRPQFGEQQASFLAVAILNHAFLMPTDRSGGTALLRGQQSLD
jgi:hypothetical protein